MADENKYEPITSRSQGSIKVIGPAYIPFVDVHMHIQGNQIAPIPIMKGILVYKLALRASNLMANEINFSELSYLKNDKNDIENLYKKKILPKLDNISLKRAGVKLLNESINSISLDSIIFENRKQMLDLLAADPNLKKVDDFLWILETISEITRFDKSIVGSLVTKGISFLRSDNEKALRSIIDDFVTSNFGDYGKITRFSSYDIAKIYINDSDTENNSIGYANHKISYDKFDDDKYSDAKKSQCNKDLKELLNRNRNDYFYELSKDFFDNTDNKKLIYQFSIVHGMELMYAHYWGAAGIPIYIKSGSEIFEVRNSVYSKDNLFFNIYDIPEADVERNLAKYKTTKERVDGKTKKYIHFLKKIDPKELYQLEDHELHVNYQKLVAYKNPFNLLPFYHIDLRRFFAPTDSIAETHSFYDFDNKTIYSSNEVMDQCDGKSKKTAKDFIGFKLKSSFKDIKNYFVAESVEELGDNTLFWGIKMYVALGYPPYYGLDLDLTKKVFPMFVDNDLSLLHNNVENFYKFCIEKDIPITCHGSPQGMTIADPEIYLKEYLKLNKHKEVPYNFIISAESYIQGLGLIDDFSSPYSWEKVLTYPGLSKLRLCIAHFGGSRFFDGTFYSIDDNPPCYSWQSKINELVEKYPNVYTDISCYTFDADKDHKIPLRKLDKEAKQKNLTIYDLIWKEGEMIDIQITQQLQISKKINKYITSDVIKKIKETQQNLYYRIYKTAKELIKLLKGNEALKNKIMYGTDWPMFETNEKLDTYQGNLFAVLKLVTLQMGNKWDAWYQFAVINPLRYLNLIEDNGNGYVFSDIGKKKLENYKQALEKMSDTVQNIAADSHIDFNISGLVSGDDYKTSLEGIYDKIKKYWLIPNYVIPYSENIMKKKEKSS